MPRQEIYRYNGINFRSHTEISWAKFFDKRAWTWHYEPRTIYGNGTRWTPDFELKAPGFDGLVEVKWDINFNHEHILRAYDCWHDKSARPNILYLAGRPLGEGQIGWILRKGEIWDRSSAWQNAYLTQDGKVGVYSRFSNNLDTSFIDRKDLPITRSKKLPAYSRVVALCVILIILISAVF